jgi:hypothetical protein
MLCEYKHSLGIPRQGFHAARIPIVDSALNDVLGTLGLAFITYKLYPDIRYMTHLGLWLILGAFFHWVFCVYE